MKLAGISEQATKGIMEWCREKGITYVRGNRFDPNGIMDLSWKMGEHGNRRYGWINVAQRNDGTMTVQAVVTSCKDGSEHDRLMTSDLRNVPLERQIGRAHV